MTLEELQALLSAGEFHHATYRNIGTLWEGLWIYVRNPNGMRGFDVVGCFAKDSPLLSQAENMCAGTGISLGAYGQG